MIKDFKQFVPSRVCLKCDGCCRFKEEDSRWRPHITPDEKKAAAKPALVDKVFAGHVVSADGRINVTRSGDVCLCHFFNPKDNTCGIYHARPFECQLYPFLLGREKEKAVVYVHLNCPHVQEHWNDGTYKEYTAYLQEFFKREDVLNFLKSNPSLITDYSAFRDELDAVLTIPLAPSSWDERSGKTPSSS